jgi:hypothetical protein
MPEAARATLALKAGYASSGLVSSCALLIRGIQAAFRQEFHLRRCPNSSGHLFIPHRRSLISAGTRNDYGDVLESHSGGFGTSVIGGIKLMSRFFMAAPP